MTLGSWPLHVPGRRGGGRAARLCEPSGRFPACDRVMLAAAAAQGGPPPSALCQPALLSAEETFLSPSVHLS